MRLYLAGPMSGIPQFNFPAFISAAADLREIGYEIISPAELDDPATRDAALQSADGVIGSGSPHGETWGDFLARDVKIVADEVDGIVFLENWHMSRGAKLEAFVALLSGKTEFYVFDSHGCLYHVSVKYVRDLLIEYMPGTKET